MFGLQMLDIILGLFFIYFVLSIVCSAANEAIAQLLNWRAETLREGIRTLLTGVPDPPAPDKAQTAVTAAAREVGERRGQLQRAAPEAFRTYDEAIIAARSAQAIAENAEGEAQQARVAKERAESALVLARSRDPASVESAKAQHEQALLIARERSESLVQARQRFEMAQQAEGVAAAELPEETRGLLEKWQEAEARFARAEAEIKVAELYSHPLILGLSQSRRVLRLWGRPRFMERVQLPSYIPAPTFATALVDLIVPAGPGGPATLAEIRRTVLMLPDHLRRPLLIFLDESGNDLERVRTSIGRWYEDAMVRVSGLYKRKTQVMILAIAFVVSVSVSADTVRIVRALSTDAALRDALVAHAEAVATNPPAEMRARVQRDETPMAPDTVAIEGESPGAQTPQAPQSEATGIAPAPPAAGTGTEPRAGAEPTMTAHVQQIRTSIDTLQALGVPLGWQVPHQERARIGALDRWKRPFAWLGYYLRGTFRNLPGLLLTTLAVSLGAPFWFDLLNKIVNIRAAGRAPEEKPKPPEVVPPARGA